MCIRCSIDLDKSRWALAPHPATLDSLIDHKVEDYQVRERAAATERHLLRSLPHANSIPTWVRAHPYLYLSLDHCLRLLNKAYLRMAVIEELWGFLSRLLHDTHSPRWTDSPDVERQRFFDSDT